MPPFQKLFLYSGNLMKHPTLLPSTQAKTTDEVSSFSLFLSHISLSYSLLPLFNPKLLTSIHDALSESLNSKELHPVNNGTVDLRGHDPANGSERVTKEDIDITGISLTPNSHSLSHSLT